MEMLDLQIISDIKNSLDKIESRLATAEENVNEHEDKWAETIQSE